MTVRAQAHLRELLPEGVEIVAAGDPVEALRAVKEPGEIERIRAASQLADAGLRQIMAEGLVGRTEAAVADSLERAMRGHGATGLSFPSIVAAGPHGALPHAQPRDVEIAAGELVVIDWGAVLDGYCSDCTRTLATGELDDESHAVYELVLEAQLAGLKAVRPGVSGRDADGAARAVIEAGGHAEHFGHGLGHGVGMEVHEAPRLSQRSDSVLAARQHRDGRAGRLPARSPRGADRGPGGRHRLRLRDPHRGAQRAHHGRVAQDSLARRTEQRRAAVWALYQSDLLGRPLGETLPRDVHGFTFALAEQVLEHQAELDELIRRYAAGLVAGADRPARALDPARRPVRAAVSRTIAPGEQPIPPEGAINEAIETAKRFCGSGAPAFINGILGAVLRDRVSET